MLVIVTLSKSCVNVTKFEPNTRLKCVSDVLSNWPLLTDLNVSALGNELTDTDLLSIALNCKLLNRFVVE